jgi:hypothetical protein
MFDEIDEVVNGFLYRITKSLNQCMHHLGKEP